MADKQRLIKSNELIFSQGDQGDSAYIVEKGRVEIFLNKDQEEIPLSIVGAGEIFGEMALLDNQMRMASARALEEVVLQQVTKEQLLERIHSTDTVVQLLMRVLLKRLRKNTNQIQSPDTEDVTVPAPTTAESQPALAQIKLENEIYSAFQNNEFSMYYQPIHKMADRSLEGAEALLRWIQANNKMAPMDSFISTIESTAMVIPVSHWVIERSLSDLKKIQDALTKKGQGRIAEHFQMSINISGRHFANEYFVANLELLRNQLNVPAENIKLELTERVMMEGVLAIDTLQKCRNLGYRIAIDDFGTGFSSLQYLVNMPITHLKIDRSFVMKLETDLKAKAIVSTIIYLAEALGLETIAEGIETEFEFHQLKTIGAKLGQGYLFSKPVALPNFLNAL